METNSNNPFASPTAEDSAVEPEVDADGVSAIDLYRSTTGLGKTLRLWLWLLLGASVASIGTGAWYLATCAGSWDQPDISPAEWAEFIVALVVVGTYLAAAFIFCKWKYRSYRNTQAFGAQQLRFSPGWAVGYYFVPIANLFSPYRAMKDIYNGTVGDHVEKNAPLVSAWWAGFIVMGFSERLLNRVAEPETLVDLQVLTGLEMGCAVVTIAATLLVIRLVHRVDERQRRRAIALGWENADQQPMFSVE